MKKKTATDAVPTEVKKRTMRANAKVGTTEKIKTASVKKSTAARGAKKTRSNAEPDSVDLLRDLGPLPRSYGEEMIYLVAQDPHWLFTYWDIDISRHPGGPCFLRVEDASGALEQEIEVPFETRNWYIPVKKAGASYAVEIGFQRHGKWNAISRSAIATTPRDRFSESSAFDFATLPMHLSFQRLVETVSFAIGSSDELLPALMKLQQTLPTGFSSGFPLEARDREILQSLLGSEIFSSLAGRQWNSEELHSAISQRIRENLSPAEVEEFFSRISEWNSESALFSGFQKFAAELAGSSAFMGSAAFTEFLSRIQPLQIESSLFSGFQKLSQEFAASSSALGSAAFTEQFALNLSSWLTGLITSWGGVSENLIRLSASSSWGGAELSSASEFAARAALSSWLSGSASSWEGREVSLQALAAISSWSSEIMAAQGFAASSWSASQN